MKKRTLREGERRLWERVARTVDPLKGSASPEAMAGALPATDVDMAEAMAAATPPPKSPEPPKPKARRIAGDLDRQTRRKLARGTVAIDGRLDLHGMTQEEAHGALIRFIGASQGGSRRVVLIITGKGSGGEGRGVLRKMVPQWLSSHELARQVVSFGPAHATHGGDGALYVRLRNRGSRER